MKIKRLLVAAMGAGLLLSACAPAGEGEQWKEEYNATIWVSEVAGVKEQFQQQIDAFAQETKIKINATIEVQSESDAASKMLVSVAEGADIYCFAQDQMMRLVKANALSKIGATAAAEIRAQNDAASVTAVTAGESIYAYPLTSDNGYFLYYDKSVVQEDSLDDVFEILGDCENAEKNFSFNVTGSGWYTASWFFGAGCVSEWTADDDGNFTAVNDTFNSANGLKAAKAAARFLASDAVVASDAAGDFTKGSAAVVSGTWSYNTVKAALGNNMGVAELPSYTQDGSTFHLGSYMGCKLMGVKPQSDPKKAIALNKLATYLTGEKCQLERFRQFGWGPSNKADQQLDEVKNSEIFQAITAQAAHATVQGQINGAWWNLATKLATSLKNSEQNEEAIQTALATYEADVNNVLNVDTNGWLFVGAHNGWDNADGTMMATKKNDTTYEITITMPAGDYLGGRFVKPTTWGPNVSGAIVDAESQALISPDSATNNDKNIIFLAAGTYKLTLTVDADGNQQSIHIEALSN